MNAVMHPVAFTHTAAPRDDVLKPSQAHLLGYYLKLAAIALGLTVAYAVAPFSLHWGVLAVPLLVVFVKAAWAAADLACMSYRFEDGQRVVLSYGVLSRTAVSLEVFRVQNVRMHQTLFQRLAGVGTVELETRDATNPAIRVIGMRTPEAFRQTMTAYVQKARKARGVQEAAVN